MLVRVLPYTLYTSDMCRHLRRRQAEEGDEQVEERRTQLAERSKEEEELAARVELEVQRRVAEAVLTEEIAHRIQQKLVVRNVARSQGIGFGSRSSLSSLCRAFPCHAPHPAEADCHRLGLGL